MRWRRALRRLALIWSAGTAILLFGAALHVLTEPDFPLGMGMIQTKGLAGLWATLVPAVTGLGGVFLVRKSGRLGAGLLLVYSAFWSLVLASLVPTAWHGSRVGVAVVVTLLTAFVLVGAWSCGILSGGRKAGP